jgi:hypothetical protein
MSKDIVTCRFKNCIYDDKKLDKSEAIKVGNNYYHKECNEIKENIRLIVDLFTKHINSNVIYSVLMRVINEIVFTKKIDSKFLLFGLKYYIQNKIPLNYPQGLYYVIQNKDVKNTYDKHLTKQQIKENKVTLTDEKDEIQFDFKSTKTKGFGDILQ